MLKEAVAEVELGVEGAASKVLHFAVPLVGRELGNVAFVSYVRFRKPPSYSNGSAPHVASVTHFSIMTVFRKPVGGEPWRRALTYLGYQSERGQELEMCCRMYTHLDHESSRRVESSGANTVQLQDTVAEGC
jgi:hypothetical protein